MGQSTQKPRVLEPRLVPPEGSKPVGVLPNGDMIYEKEFLVETKEPVMDGKQQRYKKHPTTGEPVVAVNKIVRTFETKQFTLQPMGCGNVHLNFGFKADPETQKLIDREKKVNQFIRDFAEKAVDAGLDDAELAIAALSEK